MEVAKVATEQVTPSIEEAVTEEQPLNSEELSNDSSSTSEEGTDGTDTVEEEESSEELTSLNVFEGRDFGFESTS